MGIEAEESETGKAFNWARGGRGRNAPLINVNRVCRRGQSLTVEFSYIVWN